MTDLPVLGQSDIGAIAALCDRAVVDPPNHDVLLVALFDPEQPAVVRGDPTIGVVATVDGDDGAHIRLLAVDPDRRRAGYGSKLLDAAEATARSSGQRTLTTGADAPFYLWPGVPVTETPMLCLFERRHYARVETNFDMGIDLASIPADPGGHRRATTEEHDEVAQWLEEHWSNWRSEFLRALDKGNLMLCRDDSGITALCAFEVNRSGFLGPVAVRPDLLGRGRGRPAFIGALHELRRRGRDHIEVGWVGPVPPYAAVGGRVSNVYFVYRLRLA